MTASTVRQRLLGVQFAWARVVDRIRSQAPSLVVLTALSLLSFGAHAQCFQYQVDQKPKSSTPEGACAAAINQVETLMCSYNTSFKFYYSVTGVTKTQLAPHQGWCYFKRHAEAVDCLSLSGHPQPMPADADLAAQYSYSPGCGQQYYVETPVPQAECGASCNGVFDPINPATGSMYLSETDIPGKIPFERFYSSNDAGATGMSTGWRYSFSRRVDITYKLASYKPYTVGNAKASSLYSDPAPACTAGFTEIKARMPQWQGAIASYSNAECKLTVGSSVVATLPILSSSPQVPSSAPIEFAAVRDDGQRVRFRIEAGSLVVPPATRLKLQPTSSGFVVTNEQDEIETYDTVGRLLSITHRTGEVQTLGYDASGRMNRVTNSFGHSIGVSYGAQNRIVSVTDSAQRLIQYGYDGQGRLSQVRLADGSARGYLYENASFEHALTGLIDESGARFSSWSYDNEGRAIETFEAGGAGAGTLAYNADGSVTTTDALGAVRTFSFQRIGDRTLVRSISGSQCPTCQEGAATTYDAGGFVASRTDYRGITTGYVNDLARGLELSRTEARGTPSERTIGTQWHPLYRLPISIEEPGRRTSFTRDAAGNALSMTMTDTASLHARAWTYTYDSYGRVLSTDGPRTDVADVTTYTYHSCSTGYQCGQLHTVVNALGHVTTYGTYNAHGQPLSVIDPNGVVTTLTYDARQRLTSRSVAGEVMSFDYWPTGLLKQLTMPDGSSLKYTYDAAHRLTGIADSEGNRIAYTLDAMGNRTKEETFDPYNALASTRSGVFNTLNQLHQEIGAAGTAAVTTAFGYDANDNMTAVNAPLGRNTAQVYDELGRLRHVTDPANGVTSYGYDPLDQLISVTDPRGKVTSYTYTTLGDVTQQLSPDTGTTTSTYDEAGNLKTRTDARGKTGAYVYDALNRLTQVSYPDQTITYSYDQGLNGVGRLTSVSDSSGSTAWTYDDQGRVLSRRQVIAGITKTVNYSYNAMGQLQSWTLPSGSTVSVGYTAGKITSLTLNGITTILSSVLYRPFGPTRGWTWGNGTFAIREYDADGKVTDIVSAGLKRYTYDDAFRITAVTDADTAALSQHYAYDALDRLISAAGTGLHQSWTYDANGNRMTQGGSSASTYMVSATSNRLDAVSGALTRSYAYDASGNTTSDGTATYVYDDSGRMVSVVKGGITATYQLNALGQRVRKSVQIPRPGRLTGRPAAPPRGRPQWLDGGSSTTYFVYDEAGHLVGEYGSAGELIQETVWFGDIPVATLRPKTDGGVDAFYVHTDHLNTPRRVSRPSDNVVVWRWDSDPFGTTPANEDADGDAANLVYNLRLPGQYYDQETGLHYNYFRDYDPNTGRYVQSDPIGLRGGVNTYAYVLNSPTRLVDPRGLCSCAGGSWSVAAGDLTLSAGFGGYLSLGAVSFTCKSNPSTKCQGYVFCIGGGPFLGAGASFSVRGSVDGVEDSGGLQGWSGFQGTASAGPVAAQVDPASGGSIGVGPSVGVGVAAVRCNTYSLNCQCKCNKGEGVQ